MTVPLPEASAAVRVPAPPGDPAAVLARDARIPPGRPTRAKVAVTVAPIPGAVVATVMAEVRARVVKAGRFVRG